MTTSGQWVRHGVGLKMPTPREEPIGKWGVIPEQKGKIWVVERTVLTLGGTEAPRFCGMTSWGLFVALLHVVTWVIAFVMAILAHMEMDNTDSVSESAKGLSLGYSTLIWGIVVMVLLHAALAVPTDMLLAPLLSVVLLFMIMIENAMGAALLCYSLTLKNGYLYGLVVAANVFVNLGSAMVVAFYVLWSHRGNRNKTMGGKEATLNDFS